MASLVDTIRTQANSLKAKGGANMQRCLDETVDRIIEKAETIAENRPSFGDEATRKLFAALESSLRVAMKSGGALKAQEAALGAVAGKLAHDAAPGDVQQAFNAAVADATPKDDA